MLPTQLCPLCNYPLLLRSWYPPFAKSAKDGVPTVVVSPRIKGLGHSPKVMKRLSPLCREHLSPRASGESIFARAESVTREHPSQAKAGLSGQPADGRKLGGDCIPGQQALVGKSRCDNSREIVAGKAA